MDTKQYCKKWLEERKSRRFDDYEKLEDELPDGLYSLYAYNDATTTEIDRRVDAISNVNVVW